MYIEYIVSFQNTKPGIVESINTFVGILEHIIKHKNFTSRTFSNLQYDCMYVYMYVPAMSYVEPGYYSLRHFHQEASFSDENVITRLY